MRARADAAALRDGGVDGLIVENFGDTPFERGSVEPVTIASMSRIALAVRREAPTLILGINVLRNDAEAALSIAATVDAQFIRVNVHVGAMLTDQGVIQSRARQTLLLRRRLGLNIAIATDIQVKHATPLGSSSLVNDAADAWHRGGADAVIISGRSTGGTTSPVDLEDARAAVPGAPLWIGSGLRPEQVASTPKVYDAAIVGTYFHHDQVLSAPLDLDRVKTMVAAFHQAAKSTS